ncbi:MAG: c-type cytochrome [Chitinophagaceae bacterium]
MKQFSLILLALQLLVACGNQNGKPTNVETINEPANTAPAENPSYDAKRGEGRYTDVTVPETLDVSLAEEGNKVYNVKCSSCHKLSNEKLVGPGWKDVTKRRTAAWILNFITNTEVMLNKDPEAQAQLELCLVRMPNQNLSDKEAKSLYEFMRKNDSK